MHHCIHNTIMMNSALAPESILSPGESQRSPADTC